MNRRRESPEVNAGSMADIAFLLLIFFLVTSTIATDRGIQRKLPRKDGQPGKIAERNILRVQLNAQNQIMVENDVVPLNEVRALTHAFLDNGGVHKGSAEYCTYCQGKRLKGSSDSPRKNGVCLSSSRGMSYEAYIAVQNELVGAYIDLRNREANRLFKTTFTALKAEYDKGNTPPKLRKMAQEKVLKLRELYPMKLSEAEIKN